MPSKISLEKLLKSMEKNGFPQSFGSLIEYNGQTHPSSKAEQINPNNVKAACALGQAMLNIGIHEIVVGVPGANNALSRNILYRIMYLNDIEKKPIHTICDMIRVEYPNTEGVFYKGFKPNEKTANYSQLRRPE